MEVIIWIALFIGSVLNIILFFKIWGMTNNIRDIRDKYMSEHPAHADTPASDGDLTNALVVELKTERQMRVMGVVEGKYQCYSNGVYVGDFQDEEIMEFDKWVNEVYKRR